MKKDNRDKFKNAKEVDADENEDNDDSFKKATLDMNQDVVHPIQIASTSSM